MDYVNAQRPAARDEVFDLELFDDFKSAEVVRATPEELAAAGRNPVTGHARSCVCPSCPGWYTERARAAGAPVSQSTAPPERRGNVLVDQVIPVCILMAMVTVCGMFIIPVVAPLIGLAVVSLVAIVASIVALAVCLLVLLRVMSNRGSSVDVPSVTNTIPGRVLKRR